MKQIERLYEKYRNYIENSLFIILLAFYPLIKINQGLDVVDTSYSLGNFQFFPTADGDWMVATYLANVVGYFFMQLPSGETLVGMNFYTGLIVSAIALLLYFTLRKKMPAWIVFVGEIIAIGMCWCPTTILYNYLTYGLMAAGVLLLYKGICFNENVNGVQTTRRQVYLGLAGICLGANVAVRMPNVAQAAFILALWYGAWLQKKKFASVVKDTLTCLVGYLVGFGVPFVTICVKYGIGAYPEMVQWLFAMTDKAQDYKPTSMLTGMLGDYFTGLYWLAFAAACVAFLYLVYAVKSWLVRKDANANNAIEWLYCLGCVAVFVVLIRFYWGRGMFDFRYYNYGSIYLWAVLFLIMTAACAVWILFGANVKKSGNIENGSSNQDVQSVTDEKVLALIVLLQMFVTPLGSNNALYPMINNLFLAAPFTLWVCHQWFVQTHGKKVHVPWKVMLSVFGIMVLIQSIGFHTQFVFLDGVWGEERDTLVTDIPKAEGIYTNQENAELLTDLIEYAKEQEFAGREVILYGEVPGLSYFLDMPAAISTSWPDLDSYRMVQFEEDMAEVEQNIEENRPVVIVSSAIAAYKSEDAEAYEWFGVEEEVYDADEKIALLLEFLEENDYEETFCNMRYAVYE
ncbi:MAG: hypothetical protein J6B68_12035 [Lachnospiraceae bacterium]|nr:hypothetical protein [Lachnospiraceae bacterium]